MRGSAGRPEPLAGWVTCAGGRTWPPEHIESSCATASTSRRSGEEMQFPFDPKLIFRRKSLYRSALRRAWGPALAAFQRGPLSWAEAPGTPCLPRSPRGRALPTSNLAGLEANMWEVRTSGQLAAKGTTFLHPCSSSRNARLIEPRGPSLPGYHCKPRTLLGRGHLLAVSVGHSRQAQGRAHPPSARVQSGLWPSSFRALRPGGLAGHTGTHSSPASGWLGSNHLPSDLAQPTLWPQRLFTRGGTRRQDVLKPAHDIIWRIRNPPWIQRVFRLSGQTHKTAQKGFQISSRFCVAGGETKARRGGPRRPGWD